MDYVALYRKWRPQDFSSLIGQEHVKIAISNALLNNRIAHAYLFAGPRGTGKTSAAKILAKAVNCEQGPTPNPCNVCSNCEVINKGSSMDVLEIDAASNRGIDEIRDLREKIHFLPVEGHKRVYIIDEVHMLTTEAFNALLKTLEEPPEHVLFILATTEAHKIPTTILSRCQRYDFKRLDVKNTIERLKEVSEGSSLVVTDEALQLIAVQADGGMRDALSLLDQCSVMSDGAITDETLRSLLGIVGREQLRELIIAIGEEQSAKALEVLEQLLLNGKDIKQLITELNAYFRAVMLFKVTPDFMDIYITDDKENLQKVAKLFSHSRLTASSKRLHEATLELRSSIQPRITVEMCLLDLCYVENLGEQASLLLRIEKLEKLIAEGLVAQPQIAQQSATIIAGKQVETPAVVEVKETVVEQARSVETKVEQPKEKYVIDEQIKEPSVIEEQAQPAETKVEQHKKEYVIDEQIKEPSVVEETVQKTINSNNIDQDDVWQKTLERLIVDKKRSLHACAMQAVPTSFVGNSLILEFGSEFPCQRMQKEDYRDIVEKIISDIAGKSVIINCIVKTTTQEKIVTPKKTETKAVKEELPDAVKKALEVFGGEIYKMKK